MPDKRRKPTIEECRKLAACAAEFNRLQEEALDRGEVLYGREMARQLGIDASDFFRAINLEYASKRTLAILCKGFGISRNGGNRMEVSEKARALIDASSESVVKNLDLAISTAEESGDPVKFTFGVTIDGDDVEYECTREQKPKAEKTGKIKFRFDTPLFDDGEKNGDGEVEIEEAEVEALPPHEDNVPVVPEDGEQDADN